MVFVFQQDSGFSQARVCMCVFVCVRSGDSGGGGKWWSKQVVMSASKVHK